MAKTDKSGADKVLASNRHAFHTYFIGDRFEAGMVLLGTEVKSVRAGRVNLKETDGTLIEGAFGSFFWGQTPAWTLFSKRLPPEALGKEIILEFEFLSEGNSSTGSGWYLDDVEVHK